MTAHLDGKLVSIRKAQELTGISGSTWRNWIRTGKIKAIRVGPRMIRIPLDEIERVLHPVAASDDR